MKPTFDLEIEDSQILWRLIKQGELSLRGLSGQKRRRVLARATNSRVLLVEDCPDTRVLLSHLLENIGFDVVCVPDGTDAYAMVNSNLGIQEEFDAILVDIGLPDLDGFLLTRLIRASGYQGTIIAMTGNALPADTLESVSAGCDYYLLKTELHRRFLALIADKLH